MKIKSLLIAASAASLLAGTAHANPLGFAMQDVNGVANDAQEAAIYLALEAADDVTAGHSIQFAIFDVAGADFTQDVNLDIVITLPAGVAFDGPGAQSTDVYQDGVAATGSSLTASNAQTARYLVSLGS